MAVPPSRPKASRSSSRSSSYEHDVTHNLVTQQAGRSAVHLAAQQSAQSLREASRPAHRVPSKSSGTQNSLRKKNRRISPHPHKNVVSDSALRPSPYTPTFQSPLNPTPPSNSTSDESGHEGSRKFAHSAPFLSNPWRPPDPNHRSTPVITITVPTSDPPQLTHLRSPASISPLYTPRSIRDLGSDYSRYFSPFISNARSPHEFNLRSSTEHLMPGAASIASTSDMSRRLSDPFEDSRRLSNPFESPPITARGSAPSTRSGTPIFVMDASTEKPGFFQYMDDRLGAPEYTFPLLTDQKEDDDDMHMPRWNDDILAKPKLKDHFSRDNIASTFGLLLMVSGLLFIFVVLPVMSYTAPGLIDWYYETPLSQMGGSQPFQPWAHVNNRKYPLLKNIRQGLIDPDTPKSALSRTGVHGDDLVLVFSDEFNKQNRTFYWGDDPYWFGFDGWYGATQDLEWYDPDAINTGDGTLQIQLDQYENHNLNFRSGMLNSWNHVCFKGGIFEVSISLPGPAGAHGLWPGVWTMGNLGRPGYLATTDGLWPYTYSTCDSGITSNQSMTDGTSILPGQRLPSCTCANEDHPTPGKGRGAPEIDIAEVSADWSSTPGIGVATQSFQVAPFDIWYYPNYEFMQTPNYNISMVNSWTGGAYQQAISATSMLNNNWYDGKEYQSFAFEYVPGGNESSFIAWAIGDEEMMRFDARAIGPNGNIGQRLVSEEPMSIILNLGMSYNWVDIQWESLRFPTVLQIDYIRWYQREGEHMVTCDPPGYETTEYIAKHPAAYSNPNFTHWEEAGYSWPENVLVDGCSA